MNVVITGAAGGLGIEIVKQTLERNDNVWAFDIKKNLKLKNWKIQNIQIICIF